MAQVNLSVPDSMKIQMSEAKDINWSGIARRAFEVELGHYQATKDISQMTDVIERLKASKVGLAVNLESQGRHSGRDWAKYHAEYDELKRVAALFDTEDLQRDYVIDDVDQSRDITMRAAFGSADSRPPEEIAAFFLMDEDMLSVSLTPEYIRGFVEGARDVWNEVADKL